MRGRSKVVDRKMTIHECIKVVGILAHELKVMIEVDAVMLRIGDQHAAGGWMAACTGFPVAVAHNRTRALVGGPFRRWACIREACGPEAFRAGSAEAAGGRSWALRGSRRHYRRLRRCPQQGARGR